jgi:hypothetical protein
MGSRENVMPSGRAFLDRRARQDGIRRSSGNQAVLECVEKGLLDTLGVSAEAATLYFLEMKEGVELSRVSRDPEGFVEALRAIFGAGSAELMKAILTELRSKEARTGRDRVVRDFADAIERALRPVDARK